MIHPISIYHYTLRSRAALNSRSGNLEHRGVLIRVGDGDMGYGCIHPWSVLGDMDLEETLQYLRAGESTPLIRQALHCAGCDADARRAGVSLFDGLSLPPSHATVVLDEASFAAAWRAGFGTVKVKVGRDLAAEYTSICSMDEKFPEFRWRLDFNHTRSLSEVEEFLRSLGDELCGKIDFMEDAWSAGEVPDGFLSGVPLAVDRTVETAYRDFPVSIVKPARDDVDTILPGVASRGNQMVITSYMDHPLGQSYAAWQAGQAQARFPGVVGTCGLVTHGLFEADAFSECLGQVAPPFHPASGTGLGFDDLLEQLPWKPLS